MTSTIRGIHHITAIAGEPQRNLDFYTQALGQRLVKKTVNFDDPGTYHFYFANHEGSPGTILTFFPWANARRGRKGAGQVTAIGYAIPEGSMTEWANRLRAAGAAVGEPFTRFEQSVLPILDPDGLPLELVEVSGSRTVGSHIFVGGFYASTLMVREGGPTLTLLQEVFGFQILNEEPSRVDGSRRVRLAAAGESEPQPFNHGTILDVECRPKENYGQMGTGAVHHIAFRAIDDADQLAWRQTLIERGFEVTPVLDRQYFHSIYFREPGGILFEIATDPPGFTLDEPLEELGRSLKLPSWLEPRREMIESTLPVLR